MPDNNFKFQISNFKFFSFLILFFTFSFFIFNLSEAIAQDTSCDLCGWCGIEISNKPNDWNNCMRCLFPSRNIPSNYTGPKPNFDPAKPNYPSYPEVAKNWTVFGCLDTAPGGFVTQIYKIIVATGAGIAFLAFIFGGFQVLTAGGDPQRVAEGKNTIMGVLFGILLIIFSIFLLKLIGFEIIKIPGFG